MPGVVISLGGLGMCRPSLSQCGTAQSEHSGAEEHQGGGFGHGEHTIGSAVSVLDKANHFFIGRRGRVLIGVVEVQMAITQQELSAARQKKKRAACSYAVKEVAYDLALIVNKP